MTLNCCSLFIVNAVLKARPSTFKERLDAQKIIYIAQRLFNINLGYTFMWYSRGPYSKGLARDLRMCKYPVPCIDDKLLKDLKDLVEDLKRTNLPLHKALEIAASYVMLKYDVYPKPANIIEELIKRKKFLKKYEVLSVLKVMAQHENRRFQHTSFNF